MKLLTTKIGREPKQPRPLGTVELEDEKLRPGGTVRVITSTRRKITRPKFGTIRLDPEGRS